MILSVSLEEKKRAHLVRLFVDEMNDPHNIGLFTHRWIPREFFPRGVDVNKSEPCIVIAELSIHDVGRNVFVPHSKKTCMVFGQVSRDQFVLNFSRGRTVNSLADTRKDICAEGRERYLNDFNLAFKIIKERATAEGFVVT